MATITDVGSTIRIVSGDQEFYIPKKAMRINVDDTAINFNDGSQQFAGYDPYSLVTSPASSSASNLASLIAAMLDDPANLPVDVNIIRAANTTAYAINDVMNNGTDTTPLAFTVARANNMRGWVVGGRCVSSANQATLPNIDLLLYSSTFTIAADNAAFAPTHAQEQTYLGKIRFSTWVARGTRSESDGAVEQPFIFVPATGTQIIYGIPCMQNAYTPVSVEELQFRVNVERYPVE